MDDIKIIIAQLESGEIGDMTQLASDLRSWHDQLLKQKHEDQAKKARLRERVKERDCLYEVITRLQASKTEADMETTFQEVVHLIPQGFQYPERTGACIRLGRRTWCSPGFRMSDGGLVASKEVEDGIILELRVGLQIDKPGAPDSGLADTAVKPPRYLPEEQLLIEKILRLLARQYADHVTFQKLAESEQLFRTTLYSIGDGIITTDKNGVVRQLNGVAEQLTGWSEDEATGKPIRDVFTIINETTKEEVDNPVDKVLKHGKTVDLANHTLLISRDGREIPIADSGAPIRIDDGDIIGVVLVFRDIENWRNAEKSLQQNLKEKEVMLAEIHHRVKNNIAVISGLLELEAEQAERPELQALFMKAESRIRSMALVHEKLYQASSLSEIDFGSYIMELAGHVLETFAPDRSVTIDFDVGPVHLDITHAIPCGMILNELIYNGLKYAFPGSGNGKITISLSERKGRIRMAYRDNGVGYNDAFLEDFADGKLQNLGFQLITGLVKQIRGILNIANEDGASVIIHFPKN
ncbi:histidine kinase dimerization/phosphoacceptor domain -containing protein [Balneolales bacterium ANBcel1]|nr:histidine kinase dimerization/phosphoacceptor domain -containing protein [Balneolales bacterium ANBcel1]